MMNITLSIVICTYNGERIIERCLQSILKQSYRDYEILCIDGVSADNTQAIIGRYANADQRIKLMINPNRFPEGAGNGKWLGFKAAKGAVLGIIDQDNVIQRNDLFALVVKQFGDRRITGILAGLKHDLKDAAIIRYISLFGTDSFFAYRSVDRVTRYRQKSMEEYERITLDPANLLLTGGNVFFYRMSDLRSIGGYTSDVVNVREIVTISKKTELIIIPDATKHYAEKNFINLMFKKYLWARTYFNNRANKFNYYPRNPREYYLFIKNILFCALVFPNYYYALVLYLKCKDSVVFWFPLIAFVNMAVYGFNLCKDFTVGKLKEYIVAF